jgi:dTDP-3-amino-3,4,6-trideoxy-alpha-D-glucose transaminase
VPTEPLLRSAVVPFFDLEPSHEPIRGPLLSAIAGVVDSGAFVNGPAVEQFERAFARYCEADHCVGVASGLDALRLGLIAAGIEPGDEVLVPAMTFIATLEAVTQAGGRPVVVDVSEHDYCLDVAAASAAIGERTRFVLPVHLYGQMADMRGIRSMAAAAGLGVLEDACQAHGAWRDGIRAGSGGSVGAAFSFYPAKNLGAFGDAGAFVTDSAELAGTVRGLREHGQREKYRHEREGYTSRMATIQATVLLHKLELLDRWNDERRVAVAAYADALDGLGDLWLPPVPEGSQPVWHLYVVRTADPERLARFLAERGVRTGRHYPEPVHLSTAYEGLGHRAGAFPVAESLAREGLSLPLFPGITEDQLAQVAEAIRDYFAGA